MKNIIFLLFIFLCLSVIVKAQTQFQLAIGGQFHEDASSVIQTKDAGYSIAGNIVSGGSYQMYIVKLDHGGNLQWNRTISGTENDMANSIIQTPDSGYIVAGSTNPYGSPGLNKMYMIKFDASGNHMWSSVIEGISDSGSIAKSIVLTTNGGYAVAGYTTPANKFYVIKFDLYNNIMWCRVISAYGADQANSIIQTSDGGFVVAGTANPSVYGNSDMFIVKLDGNGSFLWSTIVGNWSEDVANSIIQTADSGYAVAGYTYFVGAGQRDFFIAKLSSSGALQWTRIVGGTGSDYGRSIKQTTDGGYVVAGGTLSFGAGGYDMYIVKLDGSGALQWSKTVGGAGDDEAYSIIQTTDGGYAAAGYTYSFGVVSHDMYFVKFDANGNTCGNSVSQSSFSETGGYSTVAYPTVTSTTPTIHTHSSSISTAGTTTSICVIGIHPISNETPNSFALLQNYPNPFNPSSKIKFDISKSSFAFIKVYDIGGREITTLVNEQLKPGTYEVNFDGANLASGVYFYKLIAGDYVDTKKMVIIK